MAYDAFSALNRYGGLLGNAPSPDDLFKRGLKAQTAKLQAEALMSKAPESYQAKSAMSAATAAENDARDALAEGANLRDVSLDAYERGRPNDAASWMSWMKTKANAFDYNQGLGGQPPQGLRVVGHAPQYGETGGTDMQGMNMGSAAPPKTAGTPFGVLKQTGGMGSMGETTRDAAARMEMAAMREAEARATTAELGARAVDPEIKMNDELFNLNTGRTAAVAKGRAGAEAAGGLVKGQGEAATFFDPQVSMQRLRGQEAANEAVVNRYQMPAQQAAEGRAQVEGLRNEGALARTQLTTNTNQLIALVREYSRQAANVSLTEEQRQMNAQAATAIAQVLKGYGIDLGTGIR